MIKNLNFLKISYERRVKLDEKIEEFLFDLKVCLVLKK